MGKDMPFHEPEAVKGVYEYVFKRRYTYRRAAHELGLSKSSVGRIAAQIRKGHIVFRNGEPIWTFKQRPKKRHPNPHRRRRGRQGPQAWINGKNG